MTIVEAALERAKKLREQTSRQGGTAASASGSPASRKISSDAVAVPPPLVRLDFPLFHPDPRSCETNRVLIAPDSDQFSVVSDAYRIVRTRLSHRVEAEHWDSLAVTSVGPDEGKSVTALNLALAMASEKKRNVFLLDLDLRNPSLCQYLGVQPRLGIGQFLGGEGNAEDVFLSIGVESLVLAGSQTSFEGSAELLGGERLGELLGAIRKIDPTALILADLPPLLSVADALVVAPKLTATLLVVAEGKTRREGLARAYELLGGVTIAGIVLNYSRAAIKHYYG